MHKSKIFFILSLSFIGGIFAASFYYPKFVDVFYLFAALVLSLIALVVFYGSKKGCLIIFAMLFFLGGDWMTSVRLEKIVDLDAGNKKFSGEVTVSKEPERKGRMQKIVIRTEDERRFLLNAYDYAEYAYGDRLKIDCNLEIPEKIEGFDYQMYLAKDGISHLCKSPKIEVLEKNQDAAYGYLIRLKNNLQDKIEKLLPAPQSGLLMGLLLGGDDNVSEAVQEDFSKTGLTHIVAVSGYNVTIIAEYLMLFGIFAGLWRKQAFWLAIVGIILFVTMVGLPSSAVRAGVMGSLILWAMKNGRLGSAQNAIIFAASAMLFVNPLLLRWDVGFQLSFLATLGIVYFHPLIERYSIKKNGISFFSEILFLTLSAQIFVLPVILHDFGTLSLISPLANLLVLPIIPLTMLLGFLMLVFSFAFTPLATIFAWLTFLPLKYETMIIEFLADLKFASVEVASFSWAWVVIWYIILIGILVFSKKRREKQEVPF